MKLSLQPAARSDVLRQFEWYLDQSSQKLGERFLDAVQASAGVIVEQPHIGSPRSFANPRLAGLRVWPVKDFEVMGIYYLVKADEIVIVRILHGRRDIEALLDND